MIPASPLNALSVMSAAETSAAGLGEPDPKILAFILVIGVLVIARVVWIVARSVRNKRTRSDNGATDASEMAAFAANSGLEDDDYESDDDVAAAKDTDGPLLPGAPTWTSAAEHAATLNDTDNNAAPEARDAAEAPAATGTLPAGYGQANTPSDWDTGTWPVVTSATANAGDSGEPSDPEPAAPSDAATAAPDGAGITGDVGDVAVTDSDSLEAGEAEQPHDAYSATAAPAGVPAAWDTGWAAPPRPRAGGPAARASASDTDDDDLISALEHLDELHTRVTGAPATNPALATNPITGQTHNRERVPAKDPDTDAAPVARVRPEDAGSEQPTHFPGEVPGPARLEKFIAPADDTDTESLEDRESTEAPAPTGPTGADVSDVSDFADFYVPDLPIGSNTTGEVPGAADIDAAAALGAAWAERDADTAAAIAARIPGVAHTAHLIAAAAAGASAASVGHLHAALDTAPTAEDDDLDDLRDTVHLTVALERHWAATTLPADTSAASLALAAQQYTDHAAAATVSLIHQLDPSPLTHLLRLDFALAAAEAGHDNTNGTADGDDVLVEVRTYPGAEAALPATHVPADTAAELGLASSATPGADNAPSTAWAVVYAHARALAGGSTGDVRALLDELATIPKRRRADVLGAVTVDERAMRADLDYLDAIDAFCAGDRDGAALLVDSALAAHPHHPGAQALAVILD